MLNLNATDPHALTRVITESRQATHELMLPVIIREIRQLTPRIRAFDLVAEDMRTLPGFTPGSHIGVDLIVNGETVRRSYSLVNCSDDNHYEIAVLREENGAGGSRRMHELCAGDRLRITPPKNAFSLDEQASNSILIAGGIGITPILAMARELESQGRTYTLHYVSRSEADMAYRAEAGTLSQANLYFDGGDPRNGVPLEELLANPDGRHIYVCGPALMIKAVIDGGVRHKWAKGNVHHELFTGTIAQDGDTSFQLEMRASGLVVEVPPGISILDVAIAQGVFSPFECRRGECGMCATPVIEGAVDHRDHYLTEAERAAGHSICICVSRASGERLILDL